MRILLPLLLTLVGLATGASAQSCTGLCLQQVSCPGNTSTTLSGTVYAPNGIDPLPNVTVYIPNAAVSAFPAGVSCPIIGQPPSGSPLVGTTTASDGTFTLTNVPVGATIPLVIQSGRWRRQVTVPGTTACVSTSFSTRMPRNQTEGDIPKIAVSTGGADAVECVLRKVGVDDSEFTDPSGTGRINVFQSTGGSTTFGLGSGAGARIDASTPTADALMGSLPTLESYDVLMLPCEGGEFIKPAGQLANLIQFANDGGRVYASHFGYEWMYRNPPFDSVVNWKVAQPAPQPDPNTATVNTSFGEGATLSAWLGDVGASTTPGQISISNLRHDFDGVVTPTQSWLTLNDTALGNPVMQFTFDTPVSSTAAHCGRVLFNEYHVENPASVPGFRSAVFPAECPTGAMTPQEKLLEFSLFDLTNNGGAANLAPATADFGTEPIGFTSPAQTFVWKNNSVFAATISAVAASGDFQITANTCKSVAAGSTCTLSVVFTPTALGARTGTLTVTSNSGAATSTLTGQGIPDLSIAPAALDFGKADVGASVTGTLLLTNSTPLAINVGYVVTGADFSFTSGCTVVPANGTCNLIVTFKPTATGSRSGALAITPTNSAYAGLTVPLTGTGVDFTLALSPTSGQAIAGFGSGSTLTVSPVAGFAALLKVSCTTNAPASLCTLASSSVTPSAPVSDAVTITTTSQYSVIGFGGLGGSGLGRTGLLSGVAAGLTCLLWRRRRMSFLLAHSGLALFLLAATSLLITGCGGKQPAQNSAYTAPGSWTYTVTTTDGFLTHSATYALTVTAK